MPIQVQQFPILDSGEMSPFHQALQSGLQTFTQGMKASYLPKNLHEDLMKKELANQISQVQAKYAEPMANQDLQKAQLYNQYYGKDINSQIDLRGAQAGLASSEADKNKFMVAHPEYMNMMAAYYDDMKKGQTGAASTNNSMTDTSSSSTAGAAAAQPEEEYGDYGVPIPKVSNMAKDQFAVKLFGMPESDKLKMSAYQNQVNDENKRYKDALGQSTQVATSANQASQALKVFNNAMDKSFYTGQALGDIPSSDSWVTKGLSPFHDFSNEQIADNFAQQILPSAIANLRQAMGSARFSNLDMQQAQKMKVNRQMNPETRKTQSDWMEAVTNRSNEQAKFYGKLANPKSGVQQSQADLLWQQYQNEFPLISQDGKKVNADNLNKWPLYTTKEAINSIRKTGSYTPPKEARQATWVVYQGQIVPIKKGKLEDAIKAGARLV